MSPAVPSISIVASEDVFAIASDDLVALVDIFGIGFNGTSGGPSCLHGTAADAGTSMPFAPFSITFF